MKKRIIVASAVGIFAAFSFFAAGVIGAKADTQPNVSGGVSVSGNTVTVTGNYTAGADTVNTPCTEGGMGGIMVPLPRGASTASFTFTTDTGISGSVPYTVSNAATTQNCSGPGGAGTPGLGNPENGTFSVSFTDNTANGVHHVTINYSDNQSHSAATAALAYGSAPSAPTLSFSGNPLTITAGGSTNLTWSSTNASNCTATGGWGGNGGSPVGTGGTSTQSPGGTTTYYLSCTGPGGTTPTQSVTVTVNAAPSAPTLSFSANPTTITAGGSTNLTWSTTNATQCTATGGWGGNGGSPVGTGGTSAQSPGGTTTYNISCTGPGGTTPTQSVTVTVNAAPGNGGLNVSSIDSVTNAPEVSTWGAFTSVEGGLCAGGGQCVSSGQSFDGLSNNGNTATVQAVGGSAGGGLALRGVMIEQAPVAKKTGSGLDGLFALSKNLFVGTAEAFDYCGGYGASTANCTAGQNSLTLLSAPNNIASIVILWDPIAQLSMSASSVSGTLTAPGAIQQIYVSNSANPSLGSKLGWSSSVSYSSGSGWLSVSPSSDSNGVAAGSPEAVTIAYSGGLAAGSYQATVTFNGSSLTAPERGQGDAGTQAVTVNLTVASTGNSTAGFNCVNNACSAVASGAAYPDQSSCQAACATPPPPPPPSSSGFDCSSNYACTAVSSNAQYSTQSSCAQSCTNPNNGNGSTAGFDCSSNYACTAVSSGAQYPNQTSCAQSCIPPPPPPPPPITVTCTPSSINTGGTAQCTTTGGDGSGVNWTSNGGTISSGGTFTAGTGPAGAGTVTVTATAGDGSSSDTAPITVTLPTCQSSSCQATCIPSLIASPSSIIVPETSNLQYYCKNVTACQLSQGITILSTTSATGGVVSSTYPVSPATTTVYALACVNGNYLDDTYQSTVQVNVGGPSQCEQNPNGTGCQ